MSDFTTIHPHGSHSPIDMVDVLRLGLDYATGGVGGLFSSFLGDGQMDSAEMMRLQLEQQEKLQRVTMMSNILKVEHEARMASIRNLKP